MNGNIKISMEKNGAIDTLALVATLLVSLSIGGITYTITHQGNQIDVSEYYIGDARTFLLYDSPCLDHVQSEYRVFFKSIEVAELANYTYRGVCKK